MCTSNRGSGSSSRAAPQRPARCLPSRNLSIRSGPIAIRNREAMPSPPARAIKCGANTNCATGNSEENGRLDPPRGRFVPAGTAFVRNARRSARDVLPGSGARQAGEPSGSFNVRAMPWYPGPSRYGLQDDALRGFAGRPLREVWGTACPGRLITTEHAVLGPLFHRMTESRRAWIDTFSQRAITSTSTPSEFFH